MNMDGWMVEWLDLQLWDLGLDPMGTLNTWNVCGFPLTDQV